MISGNLQMDLLKTGENIYFFKEVHDAVTIPSVRLEFRQATDSVFRLSRIRFSFIIIFESFHT